MISFYLPSFKTKAVFGLVALLALSGCASLAPTEPPPEQQVRERATQRWQTLLAGKFDQEYELNTPAYRAVVPLDKHQRKYGGVATWQSAEVIAVECEQPERCTARVRIQALVQPQAGQRMPVPITTTVPELWLKQEQQWYFYQNP